jgi:hypothetical protein
MKAFIRWLKRALERLDRAKESLTWFMEAGAVAVEDVWEEAGYVASELGKGAALLGLSEIVAKAAKVRKHANPDAVRVLLADAISACEPKVPKAILTVPEAAIELRMSEDAVRDKCSNHEIEHRREGTRGRGRKGTILIPRHAIDAYIAHEAVQQTTPPNMIPKVRNRPKVVNPFWD